MSSIWDRIPPIDEDGDNGPRQVQDVAVDSIDPNVGPELADDKLDVIDIDPESPIGKRMAAGSKDLPELVDSTAISTTDSTPTPLREISVEEIVHALKASGIKPGDARYETAITTKGRGVIAWLGRVCTGTPNRAGLTGAAVASLASSLIIDSAMRLRYGVGIPEFVVNGDPYNALGVSQGYIAGSGVIGYVSGITLKRKSSKKINQ